MKPKSFRATLERGGGSLNWTIIHIPIDSAKLWGRGTIKVKGEINGFPFRTALFPTGDGSHIMVVNKKMQAGARVKLGGTAQFRLEPDTEKRVTTVPEELASVLAEERSLKRWFDRINPSMRTWICRWIAEIDSPATRARRADQIAERMIATMEAEVDLPPALKIAFANDPIAHEGWQRMTVSARRNHLLGIFGYRNPQSRSRRIAKMLLEARKRARCVSPPQ